MQEDQRGCVGRPCGGREVKESEWVGLPAEAHRVGVDRDPGDHQHGLTGDVLRCAEAAVPRPRASTERVLAEDGRYAGREPAFGTTRTAPASLPGR